METRLSLARSAKSGARLTDHLAAEAQFELAEAAESIYRAPPRPAPSSAEIAAARAQLATAESALATAQRAYRDLTLRQQNAIRNNYGADIIARLSAQAETAAEAVANSASRVAAARRALARLLARTSR